MTENELRSLVVSTAAKYVGAEKGSDQHKHVVDIYNSHTPIARGYKVSYKDSWCATFVSAIFIEAGLAGLLYTECGCGEMVKGNSNHWVENDAYVPKPGDIIMFDWQDNGNGDNTGWPDHCGIVEGCDGETIHIIEGNGTGKKCLRTVYAINGRYIRGFITPDFASIATEPVKKTIIPRKRYLYCGPNDAESNRCNVQQSGKIRNYLLDSDRFEILDETEDWVRVKVVDWATWEPWIKKVDLE